MSSIHGHEVLQMMLSSQEHYTTDSLISAIMTQFGHDSRFHTCSKSDLTAAQLVSFLADKGKFIPSDHGFTTSEKKICKH